MKKWALALIFTCACSSGNGDPSDVIDASTDPGVEAGDGLVSDSWETGDTGDQPGLPDPAFVHKLDSPQQVKASDKYLIDEPTMYRTVDRLPVLDVRSLSMAGGIVWVGTAQGMFRYDPVEDRFDAVPLGEEADKEPVVDIARQMLVDGRVLVVQPGRLHLLDPLTGDVRSATSEGAVFTSVASGNEEGWVGTADAGLWRLDLDTSEGEVNVDPVAGTGPLPVVNDVAADDAGKVWMATGEGVKVWDGETLGSMTSGDSALAADDVRVVEAVDTAVVAGTSKGLAWLVEGGGIGVEAGVGGLPSDDLTTMAYGSGRWVVGHGVGATVFSFTPQASPSIGQVEHYVSKRWLPLDEVRAVAADHDGSVWIGTAGGITRIDRVERTFAEKAAYHEGLLDAHFWRMDGFVSSDAYTDDPWDPTEWSVRDKDNDGLWTQMQIGAWCYAYAATGDEDYYDKARKAMDVMLLQIDIPARDFEAAGLTRGFVTRSLVRDDEGAVFEEKKTRPNWHLVSWEDGHDYYWKDDTSSDETTGHFFGYPLFYDLCAKDDEERAEIADYAGALAAYIVDNGYLLIDLDGVETTHGHWQPERLAAAVDGMDACIEAFMESGEPEKAIEWCGGSRYGEGWLNSIEILGHLLAAWHMTGDPKFHNAYDELIEVHRYDEVAMPHEETFTITNPSFMNHSDHELAMLAYHTLIRYEPDDARRQKWIESLLFLYEWEKVERNPLWAAFTALLAGFEHTVMDEALQSLREMLDDRREWRVDNQHRKDALEWPDDRHGDEQWDRVFPYDEIRTIWWNGNFHDKVEGGDGRGVSGPMAWLLPYWALRYAGVIGD